MAKTETETVDEMVTFVLLPDREHVGLARCLVRAALEYRGLGDHADDAGIITSELVTNAMQHACADPIKDKIAVILMRVWHRQAIAVVVSDSSPIPPVKRTTTVANERGWGLQIVEKLSAYWGWNPESSGKAVYAVLTKEK